MIIPGKIKGFRGNEILIIATVPDIDEIKLKKIQNCEIHLDDGRTITLKQRKYIYSLLRDISNWSGYDLEETKCVLKNEFCSIYNISSFSLSDVDIGIASEFLEWLIEFCIVEDVPCKEPLLYRTNNINRMLYACVVNRKCAICGAKADIHEYDRVGIGRDRENIVHVGQKVQPLCRIHHSECHFRGQETFDSFYKMSYIKLTEEMCRKIGWNTETN